MTSISKHLPGQHDQSTHGNRNTESWLVSSMQQMIDMTSRMGSNTMFGPGTRFKTILKHGKFFPGPTPSENERLLDEHNIQRGRAKECFQNATQATLFNGQSNLTYVEGYALSSNIPIPIHHAWLLTPNGEVVDPTWHEGSGITSGSEYYGIAFDSDWARRRMVETEVYGIFQGIDEAPLHHPGGLGEAIAVDVSKHAVHNQLDHGRRGARSWPDPGEFGKPIESQGSKKKTGRIFDDLPALVVPTREKSVGWEVTDEEIAAAESIFNATLELPNGDIVRSVVEGVEIPGRGYDLIVRGKLFIEDELGEIDIASYGRVLERDGNVYNGSFFIRRQWQGRGIGTMFLSHWEDELASAGFTEMQVSTDQVGNYAWAIAGYEFAGLSGRERINDKLKSIAKVRAEDLKGNRKLWAEIQDLTRSVDAGYKAQPIDFATLGVGEPDEIYDTEHFGKGFMLYSSGGWLGKKPLDTVEKLIDHARTVWKRWAQEDPAAIENDDPEFLAELVGAISKHLDDHDEKDHGNWADGQTKPDIRDTVGRGKPHRYKYVSGDRRLWETGKVSRDTVRRRINQIKSLVAKHHDVPSDLQVDYWLDWDKYKDEVALGQGGSYPLARFEPKGRYGNDRNRIIISPSIAMGFFDDELTSYRILTHEMLHAASDIGNEFGLIGFDQTLEEGMAEIGSMKLWADELDISGFAQDPDGRARTQFPDDPIASLVARSTYDRHVGNLLLQSADEVGFDRDAMWERMTGWWESGDSTSFQRYEAFGDAKDSEAVKAERIQDAKDSFKRLAETTNFPEHIPDWRESLEEQIAEYEKNPPGPSWEWESNERFKRMAQAATEAGIDLDKFRSPVDDSTWELQQLEYKVRQKEAPTKSAYEDQEAVARGVLYWFLGGGDEN